MFAQKKCLSVIHFIKFYYESVEAVNAVETYLNPHLASYVAGEPYIQKFSRKEKF